MLNLKINPALGINKSLEEELLDENSPFFKLFFNIKSELRIQEHEILHYFAEIIRQGEVEKRELLMEIQAKEDRKEKSRLEKEEEAYHHLPQLKPETTQRDLDRWLDALLAYPPTANTPDKLADQLAIHHYMLMTNYQQQIAAQLGTQIVLPDMPSEISERHHWNLIKKPAMKIPALKVPQTFKAPASITQILQYNPGLIDQIAPALSAEPTPIKEGVIPPPPPPPDTSRLYGFACHHANANVGYFRAMDMAREIINYNIAEIIKHNINPEDHRFIHRVIDHIDFSMKQLKEKAHAVTAAMQQNNIRALILEFRPNKDEIPAEAMTAEPVFIEKPKPTSTNTATAESTSTTTTLTQTAGATSTQKTSTAIKIAEAIPAEKPAIANDAPRRRLKPGHNLP